MADAVNVCNQALAELGHNATFVSFSATDPVSVLLGAIYEDTRDAVLQLTDWPFARYMQVLTRSAATPAFKWTYQYYLPTEPFCLKVLTTSVGYEGSWEVGVDASEGRVIYANVPNLAIQYTGQLENLGQWNALAIRILVKMLASELAKGLTGQTALAEEKLKEALALVPVGEQAAQRESHPVELYPALSTDPSDLQIINAALGEVGLPHIRSLSEDTTAVHEAVAPYFQTKDAVLQLAAWDFATFMVSLKRSEVPPAFKWRYQYPLPTSPWLLRVLFTSAGAVGTWEVGVDPSEGRVIYSEEASLSIQYIARVENLANWHTVAVQVLVKMLAAQYARGKPDLAAEKTKEAQTLLELAGVQMTSHAVGLFDAQPTSRDALQVMNQALIAVGVETVRSFTEDTKAAHEVRVHYATALDATLEMHPWNFASFRATLTCSQRVPLFGWAHQFRLPDGQTTGPGPYCLGVRQTDGGNGTHFTVGQDVDDGRVLYSNAETVMIEYTGRVTDLSLWSGLAIEVFAKVLASKIAPSLSKDRGLGDRLLQQAFALLPVAKRSDGHEGHPMVLRANGGLVAARKQTGGSGAYIGIRTYLAN